MPYYQRFKQQPHYSNKRKATNYRHHHARTTSHQNIHRFRSASKHSAINPLVVRLAIIILVFALLFGFIRSGANNLGRLIKIGGKDKNNISSIETDANPKSASSYEEQMNILRDLSFQILAKPDGEDSTVYEVIDDDTGGDDYISTVVRKSSLDDISNIGNSSPSNNAQNQNNALGANSLIDSNTIKELFNNTVQSRSNTETNNGSDRIVINDRMSYIPREETTSSQSVQNNNNTQNNLNPNNVSNPNRNESVTADFNSNTQNRQTNFTISENDIASVLNQSYSTNRTEDYSERFIETKKFEEILSPKNEKTQTSSQQFIPAKTPNRGNTENSTREYEYQQENLTKTFDQNTTINNNFDFEENKIIDNKANITIPTANNQIIINPNNTTESITSERSEVLDTNNVEDNIKSEVVDTINRNLQSNTHHSNNQIEENINRNNSTTENRQQETTSNSWSININRNNNSQQQEPSRTVRGSRTKPSIFLAQYDERLGNITIIPKERDMNRNTTLEEAILSLLEGAKEEEYNNNIISLISRNTSLLDLFVEDETVYLNFSDDFEFNPLGDEGIIVQIYQIVYTATQFEGINKVVFLIDGEHKEFLGSEGQILNKEFTRMEVNSIETEH